MVLRAAICLGSGLVTLTRVGNPAPYGITYMWNLKIDTNELIYKTETYSQT